MKKFTLILLLVFFSTLIFAQNEDVLLTIGDKKVSKEEFSYIYKKNNSDNLNEQSLDEYLELFKNFKLKVVEAESLKMDTSSSFINELSGYRNQLAKPYLIENVKIEEFVKEAYNRNKTEIKLDIIFIKLSKNATPKDSTVAYEKAMKIKERILKGESFEKVASETSDDRQVAKNKGHLSFLPSLRIPYSIQNHAFGPNKNELSDPIRTDFGYYLVKLVDSRPAQGFFKVSHIMISAPKQMKEEEKKIKKQKVDSIYSRILEGDKFEDLVKFSDDKGTAKKGGELPEFTTGRMVPEFEKAAFALNNIGDISKPVKTQFGWHIIKLLDKRPPESFEKQKEKLKKVVENDPYRKNLIKNYVNRKLKKQYNFKEAGKYTNFYKLVDSTVFLGKWKMPKLKTKSKLFTIDNKDYYTDDFAKFIEAKQKRRSKGEITPYVDKMYNNFVAESLNQTEKNNLEKNNLNFKYLMQEYHDGMLLFDLMKKEIWDKASEDTIGLKKFYEKNISNYKNQLNLDLSIFKYKNDKTFKLASKLLAKRGKYNDDKLLKKINKKGELLTKVSNGEYSKGENVYADKVLNMKKNNKLSAKQKIINLPKEKVLVYINGTKISKQKPFEEVKGIVISDYQTELEKIWIENLKKKYKISVNQSVFKSIKKSLNLK